MATRGRPQDLRSWMDEKFREVWQRIKELERPDGGQLFNALAKVQQLILDLPGLVAATTTSFLSTGFTTGSMTATGSVTAATVTATGNSSVGGVLRVPGAYDNNLTGVGGYKVAYWGIDGQAGYVPSSLRFKRDVEDAAIDTDALLQVEPVRYRYKDAVANLGDDAPTEVGVIAEQVDALGLTWLVDYDDSGQPISVRYDRLAVGLISVVQSLAERVAALEA